VAKGLYIRRDGAVIVEYGSRKIAIPKAQYRANGYRPSLNKLPNEPMQLRESRRLRLPKLAYLSVKVGSSKSLNRAYPVDAHSSTKELQASEWFWTKPQTVFFHPLGGSEPLKN